MNVYMHYTCTYMYVYHPVCVCVCVLWGAVHAAVMAINEVLEKEDPEETVKALQNPAACLVDVQAENAQRYQSSLLNAKREKSATAVSQVRRIVPLVQKYRL